MMLYEIYLVRKTEREHKFLSGDSFLCTGAYNTENMQIYEYGFVYEHEVAE